MEGNKKIEKIDRLQFVAFLFIFFYLFNSSISSNFLFGNLNAVIFPLIGIILFCLTASKKDVKNNILITGILLSILTFVAIGNNYIIGNVPSGLMIAQAVFVLLFIVLFRKKINYKSLKTALIVFSIEHMIGTLIPIMFPQMYSNSILPFICDSKSHCFAYSNFIYGKNAGLTSHYSTNGIYLAISLLVFSSDYMYSKKKSRLILALISVLELLIIGKRAHLVFSLLVLTVSVFVSKKKTFSMKEIIKKYFKYVAAIIAFILALSIMIPHVPQLDTTLSRIQEQQEEGDVLNGREPLYDLAVSEWKKSPIVGNGWGHFIEVSNEKYPEDVYGTAYVHAHNDYLEIMCDRGILGLAIYITIIIMIIYKSYKNLKNTNKEKYLFSFMYMLFYSLYSFVGTPISTISTFGMFLIVLAININGDDHE